MKKVIIGFTIFLNVVITVYYFNEYKSTRMVEQQFSKYTYENPDEYIEWLKVQKDLKGKTKKEMKEYFEEASIKKLNQNVKVKIRKIGRYDQIMEILFYITMLMNLYVMYMVVFDKRLVFEKT